jgi:hypothetical protein
MLDKVCGFFSPAERLLPPLFSSLTLSRRGSRMDGASEIRAALKSGQRPRLCVGVASRASASQRGMAAIVCVAVGVVNWR